MDKITNEKLDRYFTITNKALKKVKIVKTGEIDFEKAAKDFLDMAQRYYDDAKHFRDKKDYINAFACINYAHGWLDAGSKLGVFNVRDSKLFVLK